MRKINRLLQLLLLATFCTFSCVPITPTRGTTPPLSTVEGPPSVTPTFPPLTETPTLFPTATATLAPQPRNTQTLSTVAGPSGPEANAFAPGVNPLTGLPVLDPSLLNLPAVLVSISNSPPTARPQAGTGFAPWIFELFIGTGTTRFMGVFYGDYPRRIPNFTGDCPVNETIFQPSKYPWFSSRVWLDENADGIQNAWEAGVGGICVTLLDADGNTLATTSTDSNGYYGFLTPKSGDFRLKFELPTAYTFTTPDIGNDDQDSDADPLTGQTPLIHNGATDAGRRPEPVEGWDAGLVLKTPLAATPSPIPAEIAPEHTYVGPIRSGRLTYEDFRKMFPASCLVFASAGKDILPQLDICDIIYGEHPEISPNTALLDVSQMRKLAERSLIAGQPVNYSGNLFDPQPPSGGAPATSLWIYYHAYAQSLWKYSPLSGQYLRFTDDADGLGNFHADTDRLTGRQLAFENIIILLADYRIYRHLQYDVDLHYGLEGWAFLFRDGQMYKIRWSTANRAWEQQTGRLRPIHFIGNDKLPFPLKPGRTWISLMTLNSTVQAQENGQWKAFFSVPNDPAPEK